MQKTSKRFITLLLTLCMLTSVFGTMAFASDYEGGELEQSIIADLPAFSGEDVQTKSETQSTAATMLMAVSYATEDVINYPLNSIVVKKTSAITGELLAGAVFEVSQVNPSVSGTSGTIIGRYTTDYTGVVVISGLEPGGYIVKEVNPPQNYLLSENSTQQAWLKADGTSIVELTFSNYPYGNFSFSPAYFLDIRGY